MRSVSCGLNKQGLHENSALLPKIMPENNTMIMHRFRFLISYINTETRTMECGITPWGNSLLGKIPCVSNGESTAYSRLTLSGINITYHS